MSVNSQLIFQIREATSQDADPLQANCWPDRSRDGVKELLQRVEWLQTRGRGVGVVAEVPPRAPIAYAQLTLWPRAAEISDLIVTESLRGHGIGTALVLNLIERAKLWHIAKVEIGAALSNPRALALYHRLGFHDDRTINLDIGNGTEAVTYLTMTLDPLGRFGANPQMS